MPILNPLTAIYGLYDPREPERIRYIGKTSKRPIERLWGHRKRSNPDTPVARWIKKLRRDGVLVEMRIIEWVSIFVWERAEKRWIAHYRQIDPRLLNVEDGGNHKMAGASGKTEALKTLSRLIPLRQWLATEQRSPQQIHLYLLIASELIKLARHGQRREFEGNFSV